VLNKDSSRASKFFGAELPGPRSQVEPQPPPPPAAPHRRQSWPVPAGHAVPCPSHPILDALPCPALPRLWSQVLALALQDMAGLRQQSRAHGVGVLGFAEYAGKSPIGQRPGCRLAYTLYRSNSPSPVALIACSRHLLPSNKPLPGSQHPTSQRCPEMLNARLCMPAKEPHSLFVSPALPHRQHNPHGSLVCPHGDCARRSCL
jgi:hypothetical protein